MEKEKKQNLLIILSSIILVLLTAVVVYFIFFNKKEEVKPTDKPPVQESTNISKEEGVYKTADGKNILKDIKKTSSDNVETWYTGLYNNKKINLKKVDEDENYLSYSGEFEDNIGQCYSHHFLIDKKTNTIIKTDKRGVSFIKWNNAYYFHSSSCEPLDYPGNVYTSDWKLLGTYIGNTVDSNGNIYVANSIYSTKKEKGLLKYDISGKLLLEENSYYYTRAVVYNNICYAIIIDGSKLYLMNVNTKEKTYLANSSKDRATDDYYDGLTLQNGIINITLNAEDVRFTYNVSTKKLTKLS